MKYLKRLLLFFYEPKWCRHWLYHDSSGWWFFQPDDSTYGPYKTRHKAIVALTETPYD